MTFKRIVSIALLANILLFSACKTEQEKREAETHEAIEEAKDQTFKAIKEGQKAAHEAASAVEAAAHEAAMEIDKTMESEEDFSE